MHTVPFEAMSSDGRRSAPWSSPRILYYSRDGQGKRAVKGEKRLLEQLEATFGQGSVQVFSGGSTPDPRRAARQFSSARVVIGPHGAGLANLIFAEPTTLVFLLPTYDGVYSAQDEVQALGLGGDAAHSKAAKSSMRIEVGKRTQFSGGSGTSAVDAYFSYIAVALGLRLYVLPYAKAHITSSHPITL